MNFIIEFLIFGAITLAATWPLARVAKFLRRRHDVRKWSIAAVSVALIAAIVGWSSRSLKDACLSERNDGCVDIGGVGTQLLLVGGFVAWALLSAYLKYNDY